MKLILVIFLNYICSEALAQEIKTFPKLWNDFYEKSLPLKSLEYEKSYNELSLSRAERHWLPRAYVAGQWFSTNDPGQIFFTNLGQKAISQSDFNPSNLNNPDRDVFKTATLGVNLPLYEGGFKSSQSSMFETLVKASELELIAKKSEEYAELGRHYGEIVINLQSKNKLSELQKKLEKIIKNYQVGSQSNPVGYSGLLGLKSVKNRIIGTLYQLDLKISSDKNWINVKINNKKDWSPVLSEQLTDFLTMNFSSSTSRPFSSLMLAQELKLLSIESMKDMEKSRFLPKISFFAENNFYSGSRDSENSQVFGLYLIWDLFNSDSYGRVAEAKAKVLASGAKLQFEKQEEKIKLDQLHEAKITLANTLILLNDTDNLLKEQTANAMKLFNSGMLSALQLAEVLNRRIDLIENKNSVEANYLLTYSQIYQINN